MIDSVVIAKTSLNEIAHKIQADRLVIQTIQ